LTIKGIVYRSEFQFRRTVADETPLMSAAATRRRSSSHNEIPSHFGLAIVYMHVRSLSSECHRLKT
jgi:hypothetical protein